MDKKNPLLESWLTQATRLIRFAPDQRAVEAELREHIEDKVFDLQRIYPDMAESEVMERVLCQMGDAEEIGRELAKIHKPWLGYLWRASQVLLVTLALFTLCMGMEPSWPGNQSPNSNLDETRAWYDERFPDFLPASEAWGDVLAIGKGAEPIQIGEYTFEVRRASIIGRIDDTCHFCFTLRGYSDKPWELPDKNQGDWVAVSDSAGNYWHSYNQRRDYYNKISTQCGWSESSLLWREYEGTTYLYRYDEKTSVERPWELDFQVEFDDGETTFTIPIIWKEVTP